MKKCERCGKDDAVVKLTRIENGQVFSVVLCQSCAAEQSPIQKKIYQKQSTSIDSLLKELLKGQHAAVISEAEAAEHFDIAPCPKCGLEFASYKSTYMLGCPECYIAFAEHLEDDLKKMHHATRHVGSGPPGSSEDLVREQRRIEELREELKTAVEMEDYEHAARLRDEIERTEHQLKGQKTEGKT
ncbi:MAG: UvrB/UvrC motif-containing protein [Sumerlaeia bacterium]